MAWRDWALVAEAAYRGIRRRDSPRRAGCSLSRLLRGLRLGALGGAIAHVEQVGGGAQQGRIGARLDDQLQPGRPFGVGETIHRILHEGGKALRGREHAGAKSMALEEPLYLCWTQVGGVGPGAAGHSRRGAGDERLAELRCEDLLGPVA